MLLRDFRKTDYTILGIAVLSLLLSSTLLVNEDWIYSEQKKQIESLEKIGTVKIAEKDVRRRVETGFSWSPVRVSEHIYQGDSIFTGKNSQAVIVTQSGDTMYISANSLVVVNSRQNELLLDINYGAIEGKLAKGQKLIVKSEDGTTEITSDEADVMLKVEKGKGLVVDVIKGKVELTNEGETQILESTEKEVPIRLAKKEIKILSPLPNQKIKDKERITFQWTTEEDIEIYILKISTDPLFTNIVAEDDLEGTNYRLSDLPLDQDLYFQIIGKVVDDKAPLKSSIIKFVVVGDKAPRLKFPPDDIKLYYEEASKENSGLHVVFSWSSSSPSDTWKIQLARDRDFTQEIETRTTKNNYIESRSFTEGIYFWRVRSMDWREAPWSKPFSFKVGKRFPLRLRTPKTENRTKLFQVITKPHKKNTNTIHKVTYKNIEEYTDSFPEFTWSPIIGTNEYVLEISRTKDFGKLVLRANVKKNKFKWKTVRTGLFFWRVRASSDTERPSPFSSPKLITVKVAPPRSRTKEKIVEEVRNLALINSAPLPFHIQWEPTLYTNSYELQFDRTPKFKKPIVISTKYSRKKIQTTEPGLFYWRVRSIDKRGFPVSKFSPIYNLEYLRHYKKSKDLPELAAIYPNQRQTLILVGQGQSQILFQWASLFKKAQYKLEISDTIDFSKILFSTKTKSKQYLFKGDLPGSWIFWRIRAENKNFVSPWTPAYTFRINYEGVPFDFEESEQLHITKKQRRNLKEKSLRTGFQPDLILSSKEKKKIKAPLITNSKIEFNLENQQSPPTLSWRPRQKDDAYLLEISSSSLFDPALYKTVTLKPNFIWSSLAPGKYYWRVKAKAGGLKSDYSENGQVHVMIDPPIPTSPTSFVDRKPSPKMSWQAPSPIRLSWSRKKLAHYYEVEFSPHASFYKKKSFRTRSTYQKISPPDVGKYHWRVRSLNQGLKETSAFSETQKIEIVREYDEILEIELDDVDTRTPPPQIISRSPQKVPLLPPPKWIGGNRKFLMTELSKAKPLKWNSVPGAHRYLIEMSRERHFTTIALKAYTKTTTYKWQANYPDSYFWRVRALDKKGQPGQISSSIEFKADISPPVPSSLHQFVQKTAKDSWVTMDPIKLSWNPTKYTNFYEIYFSADKEFKTKKAFRTSKSFKHIQPSKIGVYFWKVRSLNKTLKVISSFSPPQRIQIQQKIMSQKLTKKLRSKKYRDQGRGPAKQIEIIPPPSMAPRVTNQQKEWTIDSLASSVKLQWTKIPQAKKYVIEFARDNYFNSIVSRKSSFTNHLTWAPKKPGRYFWRVRAEKPSKQMSPYSETQKIHVKIRSPQPLSPDYYVENIPNKSRAWRPPSPILLKWTKTRHARYYELVFSKDKEFQEKKTIRTKNTKKLLKVSKLGTYFWKVRAMDQNLKAITNYSKPRSIRLSRTFRAPASVEYIEGLFPKDDQVLRATGQKTSNLLFKWISTHKRGLSRLEISDTKEFEKPLVSKETRKNESVVFKSFPKGKYYWRVQQGQKWTPTYSFTLE